MLFLWCKAEFSSSLLQFSVLHDLLENNLFDSRNISDYYQRWKFCGLIFCVEMVMNFIFQDFLINIKFNEQHLFAFIKYNNYIF